MKNFKYLSFISFILGMRSTTEIDELILHILHEKGPELSPKKLYQELCARLGPEKRISRVTMYRHMWDLEAKKLVEKTRRGWRLNERGFLSIHRMSELSRFLRECQLVGSGLSDAYVSFPPDSCDVEFYLAASFSEILEDAAEKVIREFYAKATIGYLTLLRCKIEHLLNAIKNQVTEDELQKLFDNLVHDFFGKLLEELGHAIWLGIEFISGRAKRTETLWQTIDRLTRDAAGLGWLSTYLLYGLEQVFADDEAARAFLKVLHRVGFLSELVLILIGRNDDAEQILSSITGPPREGEVDLPRLKSFIKWLMELKAVGFITISAEHFASLGGRIAASEFESWLKALKAGALDYRLWIFGRSPDAPPGLKSGREILKTLIKQPEWLQSQDGLDPRREELFKEKLDLQETWTLGDLVTYHPRGKDIEFYKEVLQEIEKRLEANPELRRKLES
jgi:hypothetical protein